MLEQKGIHDLETRYTISPDALIESLSMTESFESSEPPYFDVKHCAIKVEKQRAILRLKSIHPEQLQEICDHINTRKKIEIGLSPLALDHIVETRFDKLLEDVLHMNHKQYRVPLEVCMSPTLKNPAPPRASVRFFICPFHHSDTLIVMTITWQHDVSNQNY